jgi:hypothetical protein
MPVKKEKLYCVKKNGTRKCIKSETPDETSTECIRIRKTDRCKTKKVEIFVEYEGYQLKKSVIPYLKKNVMKKSAAQMRVNAQQTYVPVGDYPNDADLKEYLVKEILELAKYAALDEDQSDVISLKNVKSVIERDHDLKTILT